MKYVQTILLSFSHSTHSRNQNRVSDFMYNIMGTSAWRTNVHIRAIRKILGIVSFKILIGEVWIKKHIANNKIVDTTQIRYR